MKQGKPQAIYPPYRAFYIEAMLYNSESAISAINETRALLDVVFENSPENPLTALPAKRFLNELQNFVIHAAALSKFLWPIRQAHAWRGLDLRTSLNIHDDSPLSSRKLRNAIEHFDERLDMFLETNISGYVIPHHVGYAPDANSAPIHFFRAYYIDIEMFVLLGELYYIRLLANEVYRLHNTLKQLS